MKSSYSYDPLIHESNGIIDSFDLKEFSLIYPKEWLAVAVFEEDYGRPVRGYLLAHSQDRACVEQKVRQLSNQRILLFYNGSRNSQSRSV